MVNGKKDIPTNEVLCAMDERRANWLYYLYDEAVKQGMDAKFAEDAIFHCGESYNYEMLDCADNLEAIVDGLTATRASAWDINVSADGENAVIEQHYCPLVKCWEKTTSDQEKIKKLCAISRKCYEGIFSKIDGFSHSFEQTIANGDGCCRMVISKEVKEKTEEL